MEATFKNKLISFSNRLKHSTDGTFRRYLYDEINFSARLIILKGFRGVGKTTLLLQYLKALDRDSIYLTLDHIGFSTHQLLDVIESFYKDGIRVFAIDEVHKYPTWSIELKNAYDGFPDIQILATASSALDIMQGSGDLSRRADSYHLQGLSFREYLVFQHGIEIPAVSLEELMAQHIILAEALYERFDLKRKFTAYLKKGYYPYYKEAGRSYNDRMQAVINKVIESDLPPLFDITFETSRQLKKLLAVIARIAPFSPNISKLAKEINMNRTQVLVCMDYLAKARLINTISSGRKSDSALTKPDKILIENTNLLHALGYPSPNTGTERETFVVNTLKAAHTVSLPAKGDYLIDQSYTLEVGGPSKNFHQIYDMANPVLIKDGIGVGAKDILPIWMLGLLW